MKFINGYKNEEMFVDMLNYKLVRDLPYNLRLFIEEIDCNAKENDLIICYKGRNGRKADMFIILNKKIYGISLKNGYRNSLHGETLSDFCDFMKFHGISDEYINIYKYYHFGDGTFDGSGSNRMDAKECKLYMSDDIKKLNVVLSSESFIESCVDRFIVGRGIDYMINGTVDDFIYIKREDIYKLMLSYKNYYMTCPHISMMCVQPKMRCLDGSNKEGRYDIQIKWYNIYDVYTEFLYNSSL